MINLGEILPHVPTRLARRNLAADLARGAVSVNDADRDRYLPEMRRAIALGLLILRAQRRTPQGRMVCANCGHLATHSRRGQSFCDRCAD